MSRLLAELKRKLRWAKRKPRVFDESALPQPGVDAPPALGSEQTAWDRLWAAYGAAFWEPSPAGEGVRADAAWAYGELSRAEMNYLVVRDSMRYAVFI